MKFTPDYDRATFVTLKDAAKELDRNAVTLKTAVAEAGLEPAGTVHSGKAGKPPQLFDRTALLAALAALDAKRATAAEVSKAKKATQANETPEQSNDFDALSKTA